MCKVFLGTKQLHIYNPRTGLEIESLTMKEASDVYCTLLAVDAPSDCGPGPLRIEDDDGNVLDPLSDLSLIEKEADKVGDCLYLFSKIPGIRSMEIALVWTMTDKEKAIAYIEDLIEESEQKIAARR